MIKICIRIHSVLVCFIYKKKKCQRENSNLDVLVDVIFNTDIVDSWLSDIILIEIKRTTIKEIQRGSFM